MTAWRAPYAITAAGASSGNYWQYFNGSSWVNISGASADSAVYLGKDTLVRWSGTSSNYTSLSLVAVDNTGKDSSGNGLDAGDVINVTTRGGSTAFSQQVATLAGAVAPIVLDLNRDGSISYTQQLMDVNLDGQLDFSAWAAREDGVLVWNKFGNGLVTEASQYAFTYYGGNTDLEGLRVGFDSNADGVFDAQDAKFAEFGVWQDANGNGVSDAGEVRSLSDWGIQAIQLASDGVQREPAAGVTEAGRSSATTTDGSSMLVSDVGFGYSQLAYSAETLAGSGLQVDLLGSGLVLDFAGLTAHLGQISQLDVSGTGANTLKVSLSDVLNNSAGHLQLTGDADDTAVLSAQEWQRTSDVVASDGQQYAVYAGVNGVDAQLWIDKQMNYQLL